VWPGGADPADPLVFVGAPVLAAAELVAGEEGRPRSTHAKRCGRS